MLTAEECTGPTYSLNSNLTVAYLNHKSYKYSRYLFSFLLLLFVLVFNWQHSQVGLN